MRRNELLQLIRRAGPHVVRPVRGGGAYEALVQAVAHQQLTGKAARGTQQPATLRPVQIGVMQQREMFAHGRADAFLDGDIAMPVLRNRTLSREEVVDRFKQKIAQHNEAKAAAAHAAIPFERPLYVRLDMIRDTWGTPVIARSVLCNCRRFTSSRAAAASCSECCWTASAWPCAAP